MNHERLINRLSANLYRHLGWLLLFLPAALLTLWLVATHHSLLEDAPKLTLHVQTLRKNFTALEAEKYRLQHFSLLRPGRVQWLARDIEPHLQKLSEIAQRHQLADMHATLRQLKQRYRQLMETFNIALREHAIVVDSYNTLPTMGESCSASLSSERKKFLQPEKLYTTLLLLPLQKSLTAQQIVAVKRSIEELHSSFLTNGSACERFIKHASTFLEHYTQLFQQVKNLNFYEVKQLIQRLDAQLQHHIAREQQRQQKLTFALTLLGGILALLVLIMLIILSRNIHILKTQKQALTQTNRLYRALSRINEAIVSVDNEKTLLKKVIQILVDDLGVSGGVITCCPDEHNILKTVAVHTRDPHATQLLETFKFDITPETGNATATMQPAWETRQIQIARNIDHLPQLARWRPLLQRFDIHHVLTIPLTEKDGATRYLITLYTRKSDYFDDDTLALLKEVREDLELALHRIDLIERDRKQAEQLRLAEVAFNAQEGIAIANADAKLERANSTLLEWCGLSPDEVNARTLPSMFIEQAEIRTALNQLPDTVHWQGEVSLRHADGSSIPTLTSLTWVASEEGAKQGHYIAHCLDLRRQRQLEEVLQTYQERDPVTGLPNHHALVRHLSSLMKQVMPHDEVGVITLINIRGFKSINAALGHEGGDALLIQLGERLREKLDFPHLTARSGSDEFVLVPIHFFESAEDAREWWMHRYAKVVNILTQPLNIKGQTIQPEYYSAAMLFEQHMPAEWIVDEIESGIQLARKRGEGVTQLYFHTPSEKTASRSDREITVRHQLERALENNELTLYHQPIFNTVESRFTLTEALIRWLRDGELVSPGEFIPILENYPGLMIRVGRWVLQQGVADAALLNSTLPYPVSVSLNLSAVQLNDGELINILRQAFRDHQLPPHLITLEITESALMTDLGRTHALLNELRQLGVKVAIDDFGTGYASLQYLQQFQPNKLKLDKSFIDPIDTQNRRTLAIPEATVAMAHSLEAKVVAEGVETAEQAAALSAIGCDYLQGFHFARPMPQAQLLAFIQEKATSD